jgi:Zn-dependent protease/CBS domain-containing protein
VNETLRLGTLAGVRVGVNWSVFVIFGLLLVGLSTGRFPTLYPGHTDTAYAIAGGIAAVAFLLSLLAHELAHAVVARRNGIAVEGITLWMLGGVARLEGEARDPAADLRIAGVGPLVSLLLGAGFGLLALLVRGAGVTGLALGVLTWLSLINVVLGVFNLVPAAPLDGGRILRAVLWRRHGDRVEAAVTAARAGRRFGSVLLAVGLLSFLLVPASGGLWLALVGWFITAAAGAEEQQTRLRGALADVRVGDVMTPDPLTVPTGLDVAHLLDDHVLQHRFSAFPVVDAVGRPTGLVTLSRIRGVAPERRSRVRVEQIAWPLAEVPQAAVTDRIVDVLPRLAQGGDGRILVLDAGRLVGIVSSSDVTRALELAEFRSHRTTAIGQRA